MQSFSQLEPLTSSSFSAPPPFTSLTLSRSPKKKGKIGTQDKKAKDINEVGGSGLSSQLFFHFEKKSNVDKSSHCHPGRKLKLSLLWALVSSTGKWEWEGLASRTAKRIKWHDSTDSPACSRHAINESNFYCFLSWQVMDISNLCMIVAFSTTGYKYHTQPNFTSQGRYSNITIWLLQLWPLENRKTLIKAG